MDDDKSDQKTEVNGPVTGTEYAKPDVQPEVFNPSVPPSVATVEPSVGPTATGPATVPSEEKKGRGKLGGKLFVLVAAGVLLLAGGASAYFGLVVPNKPENVWKKSLENTAKGYEKLVGYADSQKDKKSSRTALDLRVEAEGVVVEGTVKAENSEKNSKGTLDVSFLGKDVTVEFVTETKEGATYPDIYLKASGLDAVADMIGPGYQPIAAQLEDTWFVANNSLLEQATQQIQSSDDKQLTAEDYTEFMNAIGQPTREYLFATDEKAVFEVAEYVGKEKMDDRSVHHYKVKIAKENLKSYLGVLDTEIKKTKVGEYLGDNFNLDSARKSVDKIGDADTIDVWVDASTKLLRTIRITDKENANNSFDLGLKYTGGDEFPFYIAFRADEDGTKGAIDLLMTLNTKENTVGITGGVKVTGDQTVDASLTGKIELGDFAVDVSVPGNATPIESLMQNLFGGAATPVLGASQSELETADLLRSQGFDFDY